MSSNERRDLPSFNIPDVPNSIVKILYCSKVAGREMKLLIPDCLVGAQAAWTRGDREAIARL